MAVIVEQRHNAAKSDRSAGVWHLLSIGLVVIKQILSESVEFVPPSTTQRINRTISWQMTKLSISPFS
jgi:hypothetical protein